MRLRVGLLRAMSSFSGDRDGLDLRDREAPISSGGLADGHCCRSLTLSSRTWTSGRRQVLAHSGQDGPTKSSQNARYAVESIFSLGDDGQTRTIERRCPARRASDLRTTLPEPANSYAFTHEIFATFMATEDEPSGPCDVDRFDAARREKIEQERDQV